MQNTKLEVVSQMVEERFLLEFRELLAHFNSASVMESISAFLRLNYTEAELRKAGTEPKVYRGYLESALLTLIDRAALMPLVARLNDAAEADVVRLRRSTGIGADSLKPPAPPPPTAEEALRTEVASDWRNLSSDKVRAKRNNNRKYAEMLDRMANDGSLESVATSLQQAGA
jgi:hypothetical protein